MKKYFAIYSTIIMLILCISCERSLESEGITTGLLKYPSIALEGTASVVVMVGGSFSDPGATALLADEDISEQIQKTGVVDTSVPGVYPLTYAVSIENEIGEESSSRVVRYVIVTSEDISEVDLSGTYIGYGFMTNPTPMTITKIDEGWYSIPDVLGSPNGIRVKFAHLGGDNIVIPSQSTPFGIVDTITGGASATLTTEGFSWEVYVGCCGLFGPIDFVKQD